MGESTTDALTREFFEETSVKIKVNNLIAVIENIYSLDDKNFHELLFVYNIILTESCKLSAEE